MGILEGTAVLLLAIAGIAWIVVKAFRGGAPTGESSSRADAFASGAGPASIGTLAKDESHLGHNEYVDRARKQELRKSM